MASGERKPEQEGISTHESQNERQEKTTDDGQTEPEPEQEPGEQKDDPVGHVYGLNNQKGIRWISEFLEKTWIDAKNNPHKVYLNYPVSKSKCMSTSQRKFPTQAEQCNEADIKKGTDEINECLSQDNYNDNFSEGKGDSFSQGGVHLETSMKAKTDSGKGQVFKHTPNVTRSNLHIDNSPRVQSPSRLSEQQKRKIEQAVESMLRCALDSFSDLLKPHIAEHIRNSLRGKSPNNPEDGEDENEDEEDE